MNGSYQVRPSSRIRKLLAALSVIAALITASTPAALAQHADGATIQGTVHDSANKPVADASVSLEQTDSTNTVTTKTNGTGGYIFSALRPGTYLLRAERSGLRSKVTTVPALADRDQKHIDLVLEGAAAPQSTKAMEFADQPNFTVAGITDWTAVGGHGSDSILRTSEDLSRQTLTLKPDSPAQSTGKEAGDYTQAAERLRKLLAQNDTADLHRQLGDIDEKLGDPLAAVHEYEQAVRLDPSEQNYFDWGSELLLHRAVWQAQEVFAKGAEAYPKSARMLTGLGTALFASGLYDQAALRLCSASDLNPADATPYIFLGKIEMVAPTPLACVEQKLARFVHEQPGNPLANYYYAMTLWKSQQPGERHRGSPQTEALLTKAVTLDPKCSDAYLQLGIMNFAQGNTQKAIAYYTKAIEANPQLGEAHYRLAVAYDRTGETAKAKEEFQLHDEIERQQAAAIELQRKEVKQFLVVLQDPPASPPAP